MTSPKGMTKRERERRQQYLYVAGHAIEACRLQHDRITSGRSVPRHDLDFYVMALYRLHEIARMAADRCGVQEAKRADDAFMSEIPGLKEIRDWWVHPPDPRKLGHVAWFIDDIARLLPGGNVEFLVDRERAQPAAERLYERLQSILGE